ncbi:MAG: hypothetical protein HQL60_04245 [Magnetococcales bacterium]|nr:hypothetical protein [Magnetococcales bacterium]
MTTAERIYAEAQLLSDEMASEVLDFILSLTHRYGLQQQDGHGFEREFVSGNLKV